MSGGLSWLRHSLRAQLWPLPTIAVLAAVAAGIILPRVDAHIDSGLPRWLEDLLFGGDPGAARTVLDAVSSSLITVTSLTFSLTVVTLQLASSQFSPRLLRTFTRDLFVQATLALFLATFVYTLTVLRSVRSRGESSAAFVPQVSVTLTFVLAVLSVLGLVLFLAHLARQIRVETMLRTVHTDASGTVRSTLGASAPDQRSTPAAPPAPGAGLKPAVVAAPGSGFLVRVDEQELLRAVVEADAILVLDCAPGDFIVEGTPIGQCWDRTGSDSTEAVRAALTRAVGNCVHTGFERTEEQDVGYGLRTLADVATKALSPGINDPTTAVHALGHTSALLRELAQYELGPLTICDDAGHLRLMLNRPDLAGLLDLAITQPRRYGAGDPLVLARLFTMLAELAWHAPAVAGPVISAQLERLRATTDAQDFDAAERKRLASLAAQVELSLIGEWGWARRTGR